MGVGLDYNEDLMTKLADNGGGRYHFIEKSSAIANVLNDELKGLVATVARNLQLVIKPVRGVRVLKVFGYPAQQNGSAVTSSIGFMGGSQSREVLVRVAIDTGIIGTSLINSVWLKCTTM